MTKRENKRNFYRVLFIQPDAPLEIVQASYRTLMQKLRAHPDLGGDDWNASVINEAYNTLCDSEKRAAYDRGLFRDSGYRVLGKQHATQRGCGPEEGAGAGASWRPFRPEVLD
jgi:DnaJ-class molecular chaperone